MEETINPKISIKSVIMLNRLSRTNLRALLQNMKQYYVDIEYYRTATVIHCKLVDQTCDATVLSQTAARIWIPDFDEILNEIYDRQYPAVE